MRTHETLAVVIAALTTLACGATMLPTMQGGAMPMTSATVIFSTLDDAKDADSEVVVQLRRADGQTAAEQRLTNLLFDRQSTSPSFALPIAIPFRVGDINDGELRIEMTPEAKVLPVSQWRTDIWRFDVRLVMAFGDGTSRSFSWTGLTLSTSTHELKLPLAPAGLP